MDVTDKNNMNIISKESYVGYMYTHQVRKFEDPFCSKLQMNCLFVVSEWLCFPGLANGRSVYNSTG